MGKPTGFMDYKRETSVSEAPLERIRNFNEFHTPLSKEEQQIQGARCMNCGVPFCQAGMNIMGMTSGCPLHNLVPEWNDLVYTGKLGAGIQPSEKDKQLPGVHIKGMSCTMQKQHVPVDTGGCRLPVRGKRTWHYRERL